MGEGDWSVFHYMYMEDPTDVQWRYSRLLIWPSVMTLSPVRLKLWVFGVFLPTTHVKEEAKQMLSRSLRLIECFKLVYLHAQTAVDAVGI